MDNKNNSPITSTQSTQNTPSDLNNMETLSQYLKSAGTREGRSIPPLENWHPEQVSNMDLVIKANGEWWHEGSLVTRKSLVSLFATILWREENQGAVEYSLKTPVQKLIIEVEDVPLLINDVGIVEEAGISWLEFTTTTGDIVRLDEQHQVELRSFEASNSYRSQTESQSQSDAEANTNTTNSTGNSDEPQVRPYMLVRNNLEALIGRNTFYHLTEIGELTEQNGKTILTLHSGGKAYQLSMPDIL